MQTPIIACVVPCSLGFLAVAASEIGVCAVRLGDEETSLRNTLNIEYSNLQFIENNARLNAFIAAITRELGGKVEHRVLDVTLDVSPQERSLNAESFAERSTERRAA